MLRRALVLAAVLAALALPGTADAAGRLTGTVGPGFSIRLVDNATGAAVGHLDPGTYEIEVNDLSEDHDFHLLGPGVDMFTQLGFVGTVTWTVTLKDGKYTFKCDPHPSQMLGTFTVGTPPAAPPPAAPAAKKLLATVGPGATITLRDSLGRKISSLKAGAYAIVVRDRSSSHDFHLVAAGVDRKTTVAFKGTVTWKVTLKRGTLRFFCDPHSGSMRGSLKVV